MTVPEVLEQLEGLARKSTRDVLLNHGDEHVVYGVRIGDMKPIQKKIKKDHALSLGLFETNVQDAMYLAGLIADEKKISSKELDHWAKTAKSSLLSEYTVAWVAAESPHGWELGLKWIDSSKENVASSGWSTLANLVTLVPDESLDKEKLRELIARVEQEMTAAADRVRYTMNSFLICVGSYVPDLRKEVLAAAKRLGKVEVDMGKTACKVPEVASYIDKVLARGEPKKKKMARC
jgi:3-methyladenine DNA glycosylase AlkD